MTDICNRPQTSVLQRIESVDEIQTMSVETLEALAEEIRQYIIEIVSKNGGHLASSLGVVELTLSLLKVFNPPADRFVWDVGHQAYAYKILTGRRDRFPSLRQRGGISGFPKQSESEYDFFDVGHAGNAISFAAGLAQARCLRGDDHKVVAVVGDGSLTCGVSYEGLNQAGDAKKDLVIVLNDNEMSISPNVGAMASYLNRIMTGQWVTGLREEIKTILRNIPGAMGRSMYTLAKQFEDAAKGFLTPGRLFEELGFKYVGPIDGHKIKHLVDTFQNIKRFHEPVLVHVVTCKGKGYCQAEENPCTFHGVGPFEVETGELQKADGPPTYTGVFGDTLLHLAANDPRILAITAAMEYGTGLADFARVYPDRFYDVGIAEQHGIVFAAGLAKEGYRPVVAIYSTFIQRGYDHLIHDLCMQEFPVVLALDRAGIVGEDGPTHHGVFDIAFTRHIPNMTVMAPSDENELSDMLATALTLPSACAIRYPRARGRGVPLKEEPEILEVGKARVLRDGSDVTVAAVGSMVRPALEAADILAESGISAAVIDVRFVKPMDRELILKMSVDTGNIVTIEEGVVSGGFAGAVLELLSEEDISGIRTLNVGISDTFIEHGTREELLDELGLTGPKIAERIRRWLNVGTTSRLRCIAESP